MVATNTKPFVTSYLVESAGRSDRGLVRKKNEDAWAREVEANFFVVADGIGGRNAGEIAAQQAVRQMCCLMAHTARTVEPFATMEPFAPSLPSPRLDPAQALEKLHQAILQTNTTICSMARANEYLRSMGTTLCCAWFVDQYLYYGHLGDTRLYLLRRGKLHQLTTDHKCLAKDAKRHLISKAIGIEKRPEPELSYLELVAEDLFLICTDGLTNMLPQEKIEAILSNNDKDLAQAADLLLHEALKFGGLDNITALVMRLKSPPTPLLDHA